MKTMGSLLLFKEVFLGHQNRLQPERDPSPVESPGETFIDFSRARILFQMVLVFAQNVFSPFSSAQQGK